jgi:hypothetical protein
MDEVFFSSWTLGLRGLTGVKQMPREYQMSKGIMQRVQSH